MLEYMTSKFLSATLVCFLWLLMTDKIWFSLQTLVFIEITLYQVLSQVLYKIISILTTICQVCVIVSIL